MGGPWVIAPVVLGCCPEPVRCHMCNPAPPTPPPEKVAALLEHYRRERSASGKPVVVGFFGGPPPSEPLLDALGDTPFIARVRPDLLTRDVARHLVSRGALAIELDVLTFDDAALSGIGRHYRAKRIGAMVTGLRELGVRTGIVLSPGLPGTTHATALEDARRAAGTFDTARLHPVLVLDRAHLREAHWDGRYTPLELGQAITVCRAMLDVLEQGGTEVIRIGMQPGPDEQGRAVGGPRHPALRQLVESRRSLEQLRSAVAPVPRGSRVRLVVARADESRSRGPLNQHVRTLRAEGGFEEVWIVGAPDLERGTILVEVDRAS